MVHEKNVKNCYLPKRDLFFWSMPCGWEEGEKKEIRPKNRKGGKTRGFSKRGISDPHDGDRSMTLPDITQTLASFSFILFFFINAPFLKKYCHSFRNLTIFQVSAGICCGSHFLSSLWEKGKYVNYKKWMFSKQILFTEFCFFSASLVFSMTNLW